MRAYAFLGRDATDYLSTLRWALPAGDRPGDWLAPGSEGVRAARPEHLVWWLDDELWEVELAGDVRESQRRIRAERGRLLRRVTAWTPAVARELIEACALRVREHTAAALRDEGRSAEADRLAGLTADVTHYAAEAGDPVRGASVAAYIAAVAIAGDPESPEYEARLEMERRAQSGWLAARLGLASTADV